MKPELLRSSLAALIITLCAVVAALFWNQNGEETDYFAKVLGKDSGKGISLTAD